MKTRELARALYKLADFLNECDNVDIKELKSLAKNKSEFTDNKSIAVNLATLASLSKIQRTEWISFINEFNMPIKTNPRDSSRNILGKLLSYLNKNPENINLLSKKVYNKNNAASPELMKALSFLIGEE